MAALLYGARGAVLVGTWHGRGARLGHPRSQHGTGARCARQTHRALHVDMAPRIAWRVARRFRSRQRDMRLRSRQRPVAMKKTRSHRTAMERGPGEERFETMVRSAPAARSAD